MFYAKRTSYFFYIRSINHKPINPLNNLHLLRENGEHVIVLSILWAKLQSWREWCGIWLINAWNSRLSCDIEVGGCALCREFISSTKMEMNYSWIRKKIIYQQISQTFWSSTATLQEIVKILFRELNFQGQGIEEFLSFWLVPQLCSGSGEYQLFHATRKILYLCSFEGYIFQLSTMLMNWRIIHCLIILTKPVTM